MTKIDFKKELKHLYNAPNHEVVMVNVPEMDFLMVDGEGDPESALAFREAIEALFGVSFTLKFMAKQTDKEKDYVVAPLEGLWWADDMRSFSTGNKDAWKWTLMIMQPEHVTRQMVDAAIEKVSAKKRQPSLPAMTFHRYEEGLSAQTMHIGPYCDEWPNIEKLHNFIRENGYEFRGKHHEIYLSDPRRTKPEKLRTVLRQPLTRG